jgi:hypothetical protein
MVSLRGQGDLEASRTVITRLEADNMRLRDVFYKEQQQRKAEVERGVELTRDLDNARGTLSDLEGEVGRLRETLQHGEETRRGTDEHNSASLSQLQLNVSKLTARLARKNLVVAEQERSLQQLGVELKSRETMLAQTQRQQQQLEVEVVAAGSSISNVIGNGGMGRLSKELEQKRREASDNRRQLDTLRTSHEQAHTRLHTHVHIRTHTHTHTHLSRPSACTRRRRESEKC